MTTSPAPLSAEELAATLDLLDAYCPECTSVPHGVDCGVARLRATLDEARRVAQDSPDPLRELFHEPHHLGFPVSGMTGTYDSGVVMVKRDWYERLRAAIEGVSRDPR